jgi:hypothetical protein
MKGGFEPGAVSTRLSAGDDLGQFHVFCTPFRKWRSGCRFGKYPRGVSGIHCMKQLANALFAVVCLGCLLLTPLMPGLSVVPLAGAIVAPDMTDAPVDPTL